MKERDYIIRQETKADHQTVETLTREAFWNQSVPGCNEHYFVHTMRQHPDFVPELDLVLEREGKIIASVLYTHSWLEDQAGNRHRILTFGPLSVHPACQRKGYGKALLEESFRRAKALGYDVIVIFGNPDNYVSRGFRSCKRYNVCLEEDIFPTALLVKELTPGILNGRKLCYRESTAAACCEDAEAVVAFDAQFPPKEKGWQPSQEEFYIHSHSVIGW